MRGWMLWIPAQLVGTVNISEEIRERHSSGRLHLQFSSFRMFARKSIHCGSSLPSHPCQAFAKADAL